MVAGNPTRKVSVFVPKCKCYEQAGACTIIEDKQKGFLSRIREIIHLLDLKELSVGTTGISSLRIEIAGNYITNSY